MLALFNVCSSILLHVCDAAGCIVCMHSLHSLFLGFAHTIHL